MHQVLHSTLRTNNAFCTTGRLNCCCSSQQRHFYNVGSQKLLAQPFSPNNSWIWEKVYCENKTCKLWEWDGDSQTMVITQKKEAHFYKACSPIQNIYFMCVICKASLAYTLYEAAQWNVRVGSNLISHTFLRDPLQNLSTIRLNYL